MCCATVPVCSSRCVCVYVCVVCLHACACECVHACCVCVNVCVVCLHVCACDYNVLCVRAYCVMCVRESVCYNVSSSISLESQVRCNFDSTVTICRDFVRGGCQRPYCRYFHPPPHIATQIADASAMAGFVNQVRLSSWT